MTRKRRTTHKELLQKLQAKTRDLNEWLHKMEGKLGKQEVDMRQYIQETRQWLEGPSSKEDPVNGAR